MDEVVCTYNVSALKSEQDDLEVIGSLGNKGRHYLREKSHKRKK